MAFNVRISHNQKIYEDGNKQLAVWSFQSCLKKLKEAREAGDVTLANAREKAAEYHDKHKDSDPMTQAWIEDCRQVWMKAHDQVLEEAPPETPKKKSLFNKEQ